MQIFFRVESPETAALHRLGHGVASPPSSTGLHLGHAELRLQEQMQATVGQQQRVLQDPGEQWRETSQFVDAKKPQSCGLVFTETVSHWFMFL